MTPIPGFYTWEIPGKSISIRLSLDVVDRLQQDVIRGFGAVPRRGAEVGGVLLGAVEGSGPVVRIDEYELIPIEYKRGPSYLLSPADVQAFEAVLQQLGQRDDGLSPVGYFRSQTRDGSGLASEDMQMLAKYFPQPQTVVLLIRPFGTKPSIAGFYFKENGEFQSGASPLEFSFRRKDLAPDEEPQAAAPERPRINLQHRERPVAPEPEPRPTQRVERWPVEPAETPGLFTAERELKPQPRRAWIWLPLSLVFLLMGVLLGFQAALSVRSRGLGGNSDPYDAALKVTQSGNDLQLKWDRQSVAIRAAQKGILTIQDGTLQSKPTELSASELQSGSVVVYPHATNRVRFRLELVMKDGDSLIESVEWKQ